MRAALMYGAGDVRAETVPDSTRPWSAAKRLKYSSARKERNRTIMNITLNNGVVMPAIGFGEA